MKDQILKHESLKNEFRKMPVVFGWFLSDNHDWHLEVFFIKINKQIYFCLIFKMHLIRRFSLRIQRLLCTFSAHFSNQDICFWSRRCRLNIIGCLWKIEMDIRSNWPEGWVVFRLFSLRFNLVWTNWTTFYEFWIFHVFVTRDFCNNGFCV